MILTFFLGYLLFCSIFLYYLETLEYHWDRPLLAICLWCCVFLLAFPDSLAPAPAPG